MLYIILALWIALSVASYSETASHEQYNNNDSGGQAAPAPAPAIS